MFENDKIKSHSTLRAKRATFAFSLLKKYQNWSILSTVRSNSVTRSSFLIRQINGKCQKFKSDFFE